MEIESNIQPQNIDSKIYNIEGNVINLRSREFSPENPKIELEGQKSAIIFMPGWAIPSDGSAVGSLCEQFAQMSGESVYAIQAHGDPRTLKQLDAAEATRRYIIEKGLNNVTIIGNSQGAVRAIDTISLLSEHNPEVDINGLILDSPMGLYEQSALEILGRLALDGIKTNKILGRAGNEGIKKMQDESVKEIACEFIQQVKTAKGNIPSGVLNLGHDMGRLNPRLGDVRVPVVLLQGADDVLSNPHKVVPPELGLEGAREYAQQLKAHRADPGTNKEPESVITRRQEFLMQQLFPNSPGVKMVIAEKLGVHGLPYLRYRQAALGSLVALERLNGMYANNGRSISKRVLKQG